MAAWRKYDWGKWFSQKVTVLKYGEDYHCTQSTMIGMIRNNASQRGIHIHISDNWLSIVIEVTNALHHIKSETPFPDQRPNALGNTYRLEKEAETGS